VTLEKVNSLGLLTTVQGSEKDLKPLLLLSCVPLLSRTSPRTKLTFWRSFFLRSHYDVTPAPLETYDRWSVSRKQEQGREKEKSGADRWDESARFFVSRLKYPPFSGHNDGEYIYGRGASDDKTLLVS
jgi:Gly-Xaa carboxypeptidase